MWLYNNHSLNSYPWGFTKNGTYCGGGTQENVFSQPFSHFFRPTTTVFEGFKFSLVAKDIVLCLMFLLSSFNTVHSAFRDRVGFPWVATPKYAPETRDVAQKPAAGAGDTVQQCYLQSEGKVNSTDMESTDIQLQAPAKPQGQPQPAAVSLVQRRKYKTKSSMSG